MHFSGFDIKLISIRCRMGNKKTLIHFDTKEVFPSIGASSPLVTKYDYIRIVRVPECLNLIKCQIGLHANSVRCLLFALMDGHNSELLVNRSMNIKFCCQRRIFKVLRKMQLIQRIYILNIINHILYHKLYS